MTDVKLGQLIDASAQRDAVHVAVAPMIAAERLQPGQHVGFPSDDRDRVSGNCELPIGIVDPFLKQSVLPGERCYVLLYPNTVTSLRHEWTHPAFGSQEAVKINTEESRRVIDEIASEIGISAQELMDGAEDWLNGENYITQHGSESWRSEFPEHAERFWEHYAVLTGKNIPHEDRGSFFSCSC